jgi:hypothetical protein
MVHGLHDFDGGKSITLAIGWKRWALEISTFLGPHGIHFARCHFRAHGSQNGGFACIKIIKSYAIKQKVH